MAVSMKELCGLVLGGDEETLRHSYEKWGLQGVDQEVPDSGAAAEARETTLAQAFTVTGPGTFFGKATRTLRFEPYARKGWWFDRIDLASSLPIRVSVANVWTTARNIVLRSGSQHNYMRMVEHIIALRLGLALDSVMIRMDSGDPPLFDRSSMDLVENVDRAGIASLSESALTVAVKEPVTMGGPNGSFLTILPPEDDTRKLHIDCAVDFRSAIGKQRIRFTVNRDTFRHGAFARTNTTLGMTLFSKTIGNLFADVRNLGYNTRNILVAGRLRYLNKPRLIYNGKSLEAAWHRATLDLLAALALIDRGRLAGRVISYKAGHALDVEIIRALYRRNLLEEI